MRYPPEGKGKKMNKKRIAKLALLLGLLCALSIVLSGCIVDPEEQPQNNDTNTWKHYTQMPTDAPSTPQPADSTPQPDINQQSWDTPSDNPDYTVTTLVPQVGAATIPPSIAGTPTPTVGPSATDNGLLKKGSQGDAVKNVQEALRRLGYFEGKADGDFGEYTENAVKEFQRQNKLTPDGVVGPSTLTRLGQSTAATAPPKSKVTATPKVTAKPTARVTATPRPTNTPKVSNTYLSNGTSGANVTQMQNRLISLGYLLGSASGKVDDITEQAIVAFQKRNGLYDDGIAGPDTLTKMYSRSAKKASSAVGIIGVTLKKGDEGDAVRLLQSKLKGFGFLTGSVDGSFGTATEDALKAFQKANGLTADGKAGHSTLIKLFAGTVISSAKAKATTKPTANPTATPKPSSSKATTAPNTFVRVTAAPNGDYVTLERGTMGDLVTKLQRALKSAGYFNAEVDGYYGEDTENAVKRFQRDKGLVQDGKAGPATQRYLFEGDFPKGS